MARKDPYHPNDKDFESPDIRAEYRALTNMIHVYDKTKDEECRYAYSFGAAPTNLPIDLRVRLPMEAIQMLWRGERDTKVHGEGYEGILRDTGKYASVGSDYGRIFTGVVETNAGKKDISFLIMMPTRDRDGNSLN